MHRHDAGLGDRCFAGAVSADTGNARAATASAARAARARARAASQCDATRIISYMLDDARSEFVYDHVTRRSFDVNGSVEATGLCGNYNGTSHSGGTSNELASINWWLTSQVP